MAEASPPAAPGSPAPAPAPAPAQLPVVDLIGLRFSLMHLRLVGYGLLAVWLSEIVNLLTSPKLTEIGTRLHYTSQFLDLSPILLVAIALIAFQGGLRRSALEVALLPLLLALLPLLSALHFFLAPVSVANVITLVQKQQQIGLDQIERIDQQIDRAASILRESDSIDTLLEGLQRIPGLQVQVPARASVNDARQEVRRSLERERDRLRDRIEGNLLASREAFLRRAATNAALAVLVGLLLWGLHHGAMREMEQAIPFLDWLLVQGEQPMQGEVLQQLLCFQRACVALGWFSLLERSLRLMRWVVGRPGAAPLAEEAQARQPQAGAPPNPFGPPSPRRTSMASAPLPLFARLQPPPLFIGDDTPLERAEPPQGEQPDLLAEHLRRSRTAGERREERRRRRDLARYRAQRRRLEREGGDPFAIFGAAAVDLSLLEGGILPEEAAAGLGRNGAVPGVSPEARPGLPPGAESLSPAALRRLERDRRRARAALLRMSRSETFGWALPEEALLERELVQELEQQRRDHVLRAMPAGRPPRRGLARLRHWFLTHL